VNTPEVRAGAPAPKEVYDACRAPQSSQGRILTRMHKGRVYCHPAPDTDSPSKLFNFSGTCLSQHGIPYFLTIASEIVKICAPESSSTRTGISGYRSHERCITTMGHSPILGSLGGRLLEDSLESRFLLLELILLLEWLSCSFPSVQVNFTVAIFGSWIFVLRFLVS